MGNPGLITPDHPDHEAWSQWYAWVTERPELAAWRRRDDLRRGSRTSPIARGDRKAARSTVKQQLRKGHR